MRSPITFPAANRIRIGAIVSKLTTIEKFSWSGCVDFMYCWRILNWTPLSRSWANLKNELILVKCYNGRRIIKLLLNNISCLSVALSLQPSIHPHFYQPNIPSIQSSLRLSIYLSIYLPLYLYTLLSGCLFVYLCVCLASVYLYVASVCLFTYKFIRKYMKKKALNFSFICQHFDLNWSM